MTNLEIYSIHHIENNSGWKIRVFYWLFTSPACPQKVRHGCDATCWSSGPSGCQQTLLHRAVDENNEISACFLIRRSVIGITTIHSFAVKGTHTVFAEMINLYIWAKPHARE